MPDPPWIIDAWVNLLRPAGGAEGASIFGRYGQLPALREGTKPEDLVAEMDAAGVALAGLCGTDAAWVAENCARWPGRLFGIMRPERRDRMGWMVALSTRIASADVCRCVLVAWIGVIVGVSIVVGKRRLPLD